MRPFSSALEAEGLQSTKSATLSEDLRTLFSDVIDGSRKIPMGTKVLLLVGLNTSIVQGKKKTSATGSIVCTSFIWSERHPTDTSKWTKEQVRRLGFCFKTDGDISARDTSTTLW